MSSLLFRLRLEPGGSAICRAPPSGPILSWSSSCGGGQTSNLPNRRNEGRRSRHPGRKRAGKHRSGGSVPDPLQQGGTPQMHQARLLPSTGRTAGIRPRTAAAHRQATGMQGTSSLATMRWRTGRGHLASHRREETASLLSRCAASWQRRVVHVFDRDMPTHPGPGEPAAHQARSIMRRPTRYRLAGHPWQPLPGLPAVLGPSPAPVPQDRHHGSSAAPSPA